MTTAISGATAGFGAIDSSTASNASKVAALQKQVTALQKQLKDVQATAASSAGNQKAAEAAKAQATLITSQIQSIEQQISALSQQTQQAKAAAKPSEDKPKAADKAAGDPDDDDKARRRLQGETMGTAVDTWA